MNPLVAALIALVGNCILSLGMVLQKRNVGWLGAPDRHSAARRREMLGWLLGFGLMNIAPIFSYFSLLGLAANVVSSLVGSNVAFIALFSAFFLKERLERRRVLWSILLFAALALAGLRGGAAGTSFDPGAFYLFGSIPLALGLACAFIRFRRRSKGLAVILAALSGALGGYMVLAMRAVQLAAGNEVLRWFSTPWLYAYIVLGVGSFFLVQLAYKDGEMSAVSPAMYGMQVLWPALASYAVLGAAFDLPQILAFVLIVLAVSMIARPAKARA
jgi:drug/metabolite transporter (DMT)-like permease